MALPLSPPGMYVFLCRDDTTGFARAVAALGDFTKDISVYYDPARVGEGSHTPNTNQNIRSNDRRIRREWNI